MRRRLIAIALVLAASSAAFAAQVRMANKDVTPTCHEYDPAKLRIADRTLGDVVTWRVLTDYGLILATVGTKPEADAALTVAERFTTMCIIGRSPNTFTYFER